MVSFILISSATKHIPLKYATDVIQIPFNIISRFMSRVSRSQ